MSTTPRRTSPLAALIFLGLITSHAQTAWDGGGVGDDWSTPENWVGDAIPGSGSVAEVNAGGGVTIDVTTNVQVGRFENQDLSGDLVTLNILSGSLEETSNTFTGRFGNGTNTEINISGGDLIGPTPGDVYGPEAGNSGSLTYNVSSGGIFGYTRFRYGNTTVNLSGGTLEMAAGAGSATGISFQNGAALNLSGSGTFIFNVYGNGSNHTLTGGSEVDLTGGIISFRFDDNYTPHIGDSYDFLGTGMNVDGTGSNISSTDADGKYIITWDTSEWGTSATNPASSKGVLTITDISLVPEPGAYALMAGALALVGVAMRRRRA